MAGTDDDHNIGSEHDRWLLMRVLPLMIKYCGSRRAAEELFYAYARKRHFTYCDWEGPSSSRIGIDGWGTARWDLGFFIIVDWEANSVTYIRLPPDLAIRHLVPEGQDEVQAVNQLKERLSDLERELKGFLPPVNIIKMTM